MLHPGFFFGAQGSAPPAWTPMTPGGVLAWFKADVGVFEDTGGTDAAEDNDGVARWNDQSGAGRHLTQSTGGNRPLFKATGWNGAVPAIDFGDASALKFLINSTDSALYGPLNGSNKNATVFATANYEDGAPSFRFLVSWRNNSGSPSYTLYMNNAAKIEAQESNSAVVVTGANAITDGNRRLAWIVGGGTASAYVDASLEINGATFVTSISGLDQFLVGTSQLGTLGWKGVLTEIVVYSDKKNATDWGNYRTYSAAKWGA